MGERMDGCGLDLEGALLAHGIDEDRQKVRLQLVHILHKDNSLRALLQEASKQGLHCPGPILPFMTSLPSLRPGKGLMHPEHATATHFLMLTVCGAILRARHIAGVVIARLQELKLYEKPLWPLSKQALHENSFDRELHFKDQWRCS